MSTPKIKICGLTRVCDIAWVNAYRPDYAGFVFAKSRRQVTDEQAATLKQQLSSTIAAVGVFVNDTPEHILSLVQRGVIDVIQLHGQERAKARGHRGTVREHRPSHVRTAGYPDEAGTDRPGVQAAGAAVCAAVKLWNISAGKAHNSCGTII